MVDRSRAKLPNKRYAEGISFSVQKLERALGIWDASALVVGTVIGTGVFLKTAVMAQQAGTPTGVLAAWAVAGVLSFTGALSYAELSSRFPEAGGEYVFLREAYGAPVAFLYGWTRFWIATPASIAAYAIGAATFTDGLFALGPWRPAVAVALILLFSGVNCLTVAAGGRVQTALTALKILLIVGLTSSVYLFSSGAVPGATETAPAVGPQTWSAFGSAVLAALWAFDGWNNLPMAAGEIRNPSRNLPRALGLGMFVVFAVYVLANLAYFHALPFNEIVNSNSSAHPEALPVATKAARVALGPAAVRLLSVAFVVSAVGAMSGSILTGARVPFAMASDGLFFHSLARVSRLHVPFVAILAQAGVACALALSGTFDQLTDYVVFASWIFYALSTGALFIFRHRGVRNESTFRTPGYPVVPVLFLFCALLLLGNTVYVSARESLIGLGLIGLGVPAYFWFRRTGRFQR